jgi:hypothetical protein
MQITDIVVVVEQHQNLSNGVPEAVLLTAAGFKFQHPLVEVVGKLIAGTVTAESTKHMYYLIYRNRYVASAVGIPDVGA